MRTPLLLLVTTVASATCACGLAIPQRGFGVDRPSWVAPGLLGRPTPAALAANPLYQDARGPLTFESATLAETTEGFEDLGIATGEACQWAASFQNININLESSGYQAAYAQALSAKGADVLVDVRADAHVYSVLGIYSKLCTRMTGRAFRRVDGAAPTRREKDAPGAL